MPHNIFVKRGKKKTSSKTKGKENSSIEMSALAELARPCYTKPFEQRKIYLALLTFHPVEGVR